MSVEITNAIIWMILHDGYPLSATDKEGLRNLLRLICPWYKIPGRHAITERMEEIYKGLSAIMKNKLSRATNMAITADAWKYPSTLTSFLGIVGHIFEDGKMQTVLLALKELTGRHTGEALAGHYAEVFKSWDIDMGRINLMTTDGAPNMLNSVEILLGEEKTMHCLAHRVNIAVTDSLKVPEIAEILDEVKHIVTYVRQSSTTSDALKDLTDLKLIQHIEIRWNSTLFMLERFYEIKGHVGQALTEAASSTDPPAMVSPANLEAIGELIQLLKPAEEVTENVSGEKYVSISLVIPSIKCAIRAMRQVPVKTRVGLLAKEALLQNFSARFKNDPTNSLFQKAMLLDPRFKKLHFQSAMQAKDVVKIVNEELKALKGEKRQQQTIVGTKSNESKPTGIWAFHYEEEAKQNVTYEEEYSPICLELSSYLKKKTLPLNTDPLDYWTEEQINSPELSELALSYLTLPATSVPCERVFSCSKDWLDRHRQRTTAEHLYQICYMKRIDWSIFRIGYPKYLENIAAERQLNHNM